MKQEEIDKLSKILSRVRKVLCECSHICAEGVLDAGYRPPASEQTREAVFEILHDVKGICRNECAKWDKQGHYCWGTSSSDCQKVNPILALTGGEKQ